MKIFNKHSIYPRIITIFILMFIILFSTTYIFIQSKSFLIFLGFGLIGIFINFITPLFLIFYKKGKVDVNLSQRIQKLALKMNVDIRNIYIVDTNNTAYVANKTVFNDRNFLNDNSFEEVEAVLAHELGHVKNLDRLKLGITIFTIISINMLFNLYISSIMELNIIFLAFVVLLETILFYPIYTFVSRWREHQADVTAIKYIDDPLSFSLYFKNFIQKLFDNGLSLPENPNFAFKYLYTHPFVRDRIKFIENYKK